MEAQEHEIVLSGPADTGKTLACCAKLHKLLWEHPRAQAVLARKTLNSLYPTVFQTYLRLVANERAGLNFYGGEKPEWITYPNGARLYIAGLDNPSKALSSERDLIYVNQVEEVTIADWETMMTRCSGRSGNVPQAQIYGDCNPDAPGHWITQRQSLRLLESRHEDNPSLFDRDGRITESGAKRMAVLDALTGVRRERLRFGRWVRAEGVVYEEWDRAVHLIDRFPIPAEWPRFWSIDFGFTNPFCWQAWAEDGDGRLYRYREVYATGILVADAARDILRLTADDPPPVEIICDHDAEDRATFERTIRDGITIGGSHLSVQRGTRAAYKAIASGIQAVQDRLRRADDGKPRLFLLRDSLAARDSRLVEAAKPCCTEDEIDGYVWPKGGDGWPMKEEPLAVDNHGVDAMRYMIATKDQVAQRRSARFG